MRLLSHLPLTIIAALCVLAAPVHGSEPAVGTWVRVGPDYQPGEGICSQVLVHPARPQELLLATRPFGVLLSEDGGATWQRKGAGFDREMHNGPNWGFMRSSSNPEVIYLSVENPGILRSLDGGRSWQDRSSTLPPGRARHGITVGIHPLDPDLVLLGTDGGIFKTTNGGLTWQRLVEGLPKGTIPGSDDIHQSVCGISWDPVVPQRVLIGIYATGHNEQAGVWRSDDAGESWVRFSNGIADAEVASEAAGDSPAHKLSQSMRPDWIHRMETCPADERVVYVRAGNGIYRSDDRGALWRRLANVEADNPLAVDPTDSQRVVIATKDGGALLSDDGGQTWSDLSLGLPRGKLSTATIIPIKLQLPDGTFLDLDANHRSQINAIVTFTFARHDPRTLYAAAHAGLYRVVLPPRPAPSAKP